MPLHYMMTKDELRQSHNAMCDAHNAEQKAAEARCKNWCEVAQCRAAYSRLFKCRDDVWLQSHGYKGRLWMNEQRSSP